jgi:hypothetical protein
MGALGLLDLGQGAMRGARGKRAGGYSMAPRVKK